MTIGAVGLGTGAVSAYVRATDHLTFYEIDPQVIRISTDPKHFSYTTECAKGPVDFKLGDARLKLAETPEGTYDVLLIDAFSSDAVPIHLLTTEAVRMYLARLKPDGILILHLSNRNLALAEPAAGVAKAAGGYALFQHHLAADDSPILWESAEDALIVARNPQALADFAADGRWTQPPKVTGRAWSDDYSNLITPLYKRLKVRWEWLP
jgi:SAM-dependent methyltransferase